jgi:hypothetical protein
MVFLDAVIGSIDSDEKKQMRMCHTILLQYLRWNVLASPPLIHSFFVSFPHFLFFFFLKKRILETMESLLALLPQTA